MNRIPRYDLLLERDLHILLAKLDNDKIHYSNYWDVESLSNRERVVELENRLIEGYYCDAYPNTNRRLEDTQRAISGDKRTPVQHATEGDIPPSNGDGRTLLLLPRTATEV